MCVCVCARDAHPSEETKLSRRVGKHVPHVHAFALVPHTQLAEAKARPKMPSYVEPDEVNPHSDSTRVKGLVVVLSEPVYVYVYVYVCMCMCVYVYV